VFGVRLRVAYDGSGFAGWQKQRAHASVQGALEHAVSALIGANVDVLGASRTDAGVHAYGQIAAFDSPRELPMQGWVRGLNGKLPDEIAIVEASPCAAGYNPRFDAAAKRYRYLVHLGEVRDPLLASRVWHLGPRRARPRPSGALSIETHLDLDAMRAAAATLVGEHDFRAFRASGDERESTVRTLTDVRVVPSWGARDDLVAIEVQGNAFMQHMVRIIAGTLVDVGRQRMTPAAVAALVSPGAARDAAGETAPACGLYLVEVVLGRSDRR
jgi:tRNA pseudouridine38-40 synthase